MPPVTQIWQVFTDATLGRASQEQITLFDSLGFTTEDFSALSYVYEQLSKFGHCIKRDMLADPVGPHKLLGMTQRTAAPL